MDKEERITRYGEAAYQKKLAQNRAWYKAHKEEANATTKKYYKEHPEKAAARDHDRSRKDGKYYEKALDYQRTGIPGEKKRIRSKHRYKYKQYKDIIAPDSQLHHEWIPQTSEYRGVALVEANPHRYGIIDVIEILDGRITLLTEEQVRFALSIQKLSN